MRPVYGRSPWVDQFPRARVPSYARLQRHVETEVAIVGGGLTGCAVACAFAAAGIPVVLLEADRIGRGASGSSPGWITETPETGLVKSEAALGRRPAEHAWQAWRRAARDFQALLRRLDCGLEPRAEVSIAQSAEQVALVNRELQRRRAAGVAAQAVPARTLGAVCGFPAAAGLRTKGNALVDPYRTTLGLAAAAVRRGATIHERTPVTRTARARDAVIVTAGASTIRAQRVVIATGQPGPLFKPLARHLGARATYLVLTEPVPARLRGALGSRDHLLRDLAQPPHALTRREDERLLVSGADSDAVPDRSRASRLVQRTGQLMYELSLFYPDISGLRPAYGWDLRYAATTTGLPLLGPHRNYPQHLFAWGTTGLSLTGAYLASRILLRHHRGEPESTDEVFGFGH